ncbi:uncharacterized protein LOC144329245 [Podarcis muralis]
MWNPPLRILVSGSEQSGKSTLIGHLLYKCGHLEAETMETLWKQKVEQGKSYRQLLETLQQVQKSGETPGRRNYKSPKYEVTIADPPSRVGMYRSCSLQDQEKVDCLLFVISAEKRDFEKRWHMTKKQILVASKQVKQLVVCVNKMDSSTPEPYSCNRYNDIVGKVWDWLWAWDRDPGRVLFFPISALYGDNLQEPSLKMTWFCRWEILREGGGLVKGTTLQQFLDAVSACHLKPDLLCTPLGQDSYSETKSTPERRALDTPDSAEPPLCPRPPKNPRSHFPSGRSGYKLCPGPSRTTRYELPPRFLRIFKPNPHPGSSTSSSGQDPCPGTSGNSRPDSHPGPSTSSSGQDPCPGTSGNSRPDSHPGPSTSSSGQDPYPGTSGNSRPDSHPGLSTSSSGQDPCPGTSGNSSPDSHPGLSTSSSGQDPCPGTSGNSRPDSHPGSSTSSSGQDPCPGTSGNSRPDSHPGPSTSSSGQDPCPGTSGNSRPDSHPGPSTSSSGQDPCPGTSGNSTHDPHPGPLTSSSGQDLCPGTSRNSRPDPHPGPSTSSSGQDLCPGTSRNSTPDPHPGPLTSSSRLDLYPRPSRSSRHNLPGAGPERRPSSAIPLSSPASRSDTRVSLEEKELVLMEEDTRSPGVPRGSWGNLIGPPLLLCPTHGLPVLFPSPYPFPYPLPPAPLQQGPRFPGPDPVYQLPLLGEASWAPVSNAMSPHSQSPPASWDPLMQQAPSPPSSTPFQQPPAQAVPFISQPFVPLDSFHAPPGPQGHFPPPPYVPAPQAFPNPWPQTPYHAQDFPWAQARSGPLPLHSLPGQGSPASPLSIRVVLQPASGPRRFPSAMEASATAI